MLRKVRTFVLAFLIASPLALHSGNISTILYVHGEAGKQDAGDPDFIKLLTDELHQTVSKRIDTAVPDPAQDARDFDMVFISSSVFSGNVAGKYRNHTIPVLVGEGLTFPEKWMAMARKSHFEGSAPNISSLRLVDGARGHALAAGKKPGLIRVSEGKSAIWGWGSSLGPGGKIIATATVDPASGEVKAGDAIVEFVYEKGATLADGTAAAGLRIGIPWIDSEGPMFGERPNSISKDGKDLILAAVRYALKKK